MPFCCVLDPEPDLDLPYGSGFVIRIRIHRLEKQHKNVIIC